MLHQFNVIRRTQESGNKPPFFVKNNKMYSVFFFDKEYVAEMQYHISAVEKKRRGKVEIYLRQDCSPYVIVATCEYRNLGVTLQKHIENNKILFSTNFAQEAKIKYIELNEKTLDNYIKERNMGDC
ncbi:hypothetical protein [Caviibacterium pharyngocola]|uniref:Uncharacterized protein n=1 Tax=Caviibacterium pharyngocola TaxID=28159 RepID=A0A2M8RUS5_9PAST|nr:hypothetical protein [Caviibacterium pharyngocola]PJG82627.1 hypothetical protein CVP04_08130 [Caviibacterium pharyngocola]